MKEQYETKELFAQQSTERQEDCSLSRLDEVLYDRMMSHAQKRATLASWASDARALKDQPALRKLDNGAVIFLKDILNALRRLDNDDDDPPPSPAAINLKTRDVSSLGQAA